jgi:hypothetical protein
MKESQKLDRRRVARTIGIFVLIDFRLRKKFIYWRKGFRPGIELTKISLCHVDPGQ